MFSGSFFRSRTQPEPISLFEIPRDILRTSFAHPSYILRGFFENSRSRFGNPSRTLEELSKKPRSRVEEIPKDVRQWYEGCLKTFRRIVMPTQGVRRMPIEASVASLTGWGAGESFCFNCTC